MKSAHPPGIARLVAWLAACMVLALSSTPAAATVSCDKGGYVTRVVQGWPMSDHVIGIALRDNNGQISNWATQGVMDVNGWPAARSLMSFALTAFVSQSYVTVIANTAWDCGNTRRMDDGLDWHYGWKGLAVPVGQDKSPAAAGGR